MIYYKDISVADDINAPIVIWGHGWGQSHQAFMPLAKSLLQFGRHVLVDFPGFGNTPAPPADENWGSFEYAESIAKFITKTFPNQRIIWIGHSFGCRVGVQLAANYPELVERMVLIAGAGLPRERSVYFKARVRAFKILKRVPFIDKDKLRRKFGSADYLNAGTLRGTFIKVIHEDLSSEACRIECPVKLIYGADDTETPPELGHRYQTLIKDSSMIELAGQDHYSVLSKGQHQVAPIIKRFITS